MRRNTVLLAAPLFAYALACSSAEAKTKGVGDEFKPFIVKNCDTGQQYCQVCAFAGKPTLMAVGDVGDAAFEQDLVRIQKLVSANKGVAAFAVVGKVDGSKVSSVDDEKGIAEKLKATKARLGLTFPVVLLASKLSESDAKNYAKFSDSYEVQGSRTIMFSSADQKIVYAEKIESPRADEQFKMLEETLKKTL
jgi:hypothetical protein